jgi:threonine dehydratase
MLPTLADVRAARERIAGRLHLTPVMSATRLGQRVGASLSLKCESLQKTGSFKVRGALNTVAQLDRESRERGVITVSAGNHAQALAWASRDAGVPCTVVMPTIASRAKVEASRGYGAEVVQHGATSIEAFAHARTLASERKLVFVHPFDDGPVVAGQGTVGLEILDQASDAEIIVVPVGGGGLISGIAIAIKEQRPKVRIYGVEPTGASAMRRSLDAGHAVRLDSLKTMADGLAAPMAGELTFEVVRRYVDDIVLVSDEEIISAMRGLLASAKLLTEGGGAAATAAILTGKIPVEGKRVVSVISGGNVDLTLLKEIL